jgi:serine/threonine protein kinase
MEGNIPAGPVDSDAKTSIDSGAKPPAPGQVDSNAKTAIGQADSNARTSIGGQAVAGLVKFDALATGFVIGARYEVLAQLGQGGMGAVYRARDRVLDEEVALKVLLPAIVEAPGMAERFLLEAKTSLKLTHPGIVRVRSFEQDRDLGLSYIVMALVRGRSLRHIMIERRRLEPREAFDLVRAVLDALEVAHEITVHRDLKPENIMVESPPGSRGMPEPPKAAEDGGRSLGRPVILDFGLAKSVAAPGQGHLTQSGAGMGTYAYMAPEQRVDTSAVDARADVFAMGAILYEVLTGHAPAGSFPPPSVMRPEVPKGTDEVVLKALALRPEDRFATARAMNEAIAKVVAAPGTTVVTPPGAPPPAGPQSPLAAPAPSAPATAAAPPAPPSRRPLVVLGGLAAALLIAGVVADYAGLVPHHSPASVNPPTRTGSATPSVPGGTERYTGPLPERFAPPTGAPIEPPAFASLDDPARFAGLGEVAWQRFLKEKQPFVATDPSALVQAFPAIKGSLVYVEGFAPDVGFTDKKGVVYSVKEGPDGAVLARWDPALFEKEEWFKLEVKRYFPEQEQDVVGALVDVMKRQTKVNDEVVSLACPVIEVRWKHVRRIAAYVPAADGKGVVVAGEAELLAERARHFTRFDLPATATPGAVAEAALTALKEGNRALWESLWIEHPSEVFQRWRAQQWAQDRRGFRPEGNADYAARTTAVGWTLEPATIHGNFRGEREADVVAKFTNARGEAGFRDGRLELAEVGGRWRLAPHGRFEPLPNQHRAPPPDDAPPEKVYEAYIRAAMEDDRDLAKRLCTADQAENAVAWLEDWQHMLRDGLIEAPADEVKINGDSAVVYTRPRNKHPEEWSGWIRRVELQKEGGRWRISGGFRQGR